MDQRQSRCRLITFAALLAGATASPKDAAGQLHSNVATVSLVATMPAGAIFQPAPDGEPRVFRAGPVADQSAFRLVVNAPYRLRIRTEVSPGSPITLVSGERPGLVLLDGVRRSLRAAGVDAEAHPVTVDVVLNPAI